MKAHSAWLLSRLASISSLLLCGPQLAEASIPAVVADGQIALASGFQLPEGVAVSSYGTVYIANTGNDRVVTVSSAGVLTPVSIPGYKLSGPGAVAVDSTGDLFISDSNNACMLGLKTSGNVALVAGAPLFKLSSFACVRPRGRSLHRRRKQPRHLQSERFHFANGERGANASYRQQCFPPVSRSFGHRRRGGSMSLTVALTTLTNCQPGKPRRRTSLPQALRTARLPVSASTQPVTGMCWMAETHAL